MSALTDAAHSVHSPPSCGEGLGVGVVRFFRRWRHRALTASPPSPTLPHKGGGSTPSMGEGVHRVCVSLSAHSRVSGNPVFRIWVPAFAGTNGAEESTAIT